MDQSCRLLFVYIFFGATAPHWARASSFTRFLYHTQRRTTVGRTPLDEWSARRRDLYLTTHNTHNRHPCPPVGFEPTISTGKRPQTHALRRAATGTGCLSRLLNRKYFMRPHTTLKVRFPSSCDDEYADLRSNGVWHRVVLCIGTLLQIESCHSVVFKTMDYSLISSVNLLVHGLSSTLVTPS